MGYALVEPSYKPRKPKYRVFSMLWDRTPGVPYLVPTHAVRAIVLLRHTHSRTLVALHLRTGGMATMCPPVPIRIRIVHQYTPHT